MSQTTRWNFSILQSIKYLLLFGAFHGKNKETGREDGKWIDMDRERERETEFMYLSTLHPSLHNNLIDSLKSFFENGGGKGRVLAKKKIREKERRGEGRKRGRKFNFSLKNLE